MTSEVALSTLSRPWRSWWGQRKLGHLYLFVSGCAFYWHCPPRQPPKARSRPPLRTPLHFQGVTESTLVLAFAYFPPGPLKNPRYPCNFRCNVYLVGRGLGGELPWKKSLTHKQFGLHSRVNMSRRGSARRAVSRTEVRVFWSWHTDPTSAGTQSSALFRPQQPQPHKHLTPTSCLVNSQRPLLEKLGKPVKVGRINTTNWK